MFHLLSLLTGVLEIGWIAFGVANSFPMWMTLCFPLSYQLGNLFPKPFSVSDRLLRATAFTALLTSLLSGFGFGESVRFLMTCLSLFLLSAVIQSVRSGLKTDGNRLKKRIFRVIGFAVSPLAPFIPTAILVFTSIVAIYSLRGHKSHYRVSPMSMQQGFSIVMLCHQLHFFIYVHSMFTVAALTLAKRFTSFGTFFGIFTAAVFLCGSWITYMSVEPLAVKTKADVRKVFYFGHIFVCAILLAMSIVGNTSGSFPILWLLTGFGGGAVYTVSELAKSAGAYDKDAMDAYENLGHVIGLLIAVLISLSVGSAQAPTVMLRAGALAAFLAVVSMSIVLIVPGKLSKKVSIKSRGENQ